MKEKIQISFIVLTYNSNIEKLCYTLDSIINQRNITFEIIIADDGSKKFEKDKILKYFEINNFAEFKVIDSKKNNGTTLNLYNALKETRGKYIKVISPGDYIYNNLVIDKVLHFMIDNDYKVIFGKSAYYYHRDSKCYITSRMNPIDIGVYKKKKYKKIKKNYLYYRDFILGAAFICEKKILEMYLSKIINIIKYAEDSIFILMTADNVHINFWDNYLIWYECDTGISNNIELGFNKKVLEDVKKCYEILRDEHKELSKICKIYLDEKLPISFKINKKVRNIKFKIKNKLVKKFVLSKIDIIYLKEIINENIYREGEKNANC